MAARWQLVGIIGDREQSSIREGAASASPHEVSRFQAEMQCQEVSDLFGTLS